MAEMEGSRETGDEPPLEKLRRLCRTGIPYVDVLLALMIPFVLHALLNSTERLFDLCEDALDWLRDRWQGESFAREVSHITRRDAYDGCDQTGREVLNHVLQKAMTRFLDAHCGEQLDKAKGLNVDLLAKRERRELASWEDSEDEDDGDEGEATDRDETAEAERRTGLGELAHYRLTRAVPPSTTLEIEKGLHLEVSTTVISKKGDDAHHVEMCTFWLNCRGRNAAQRVEGFVHKAFSWYCAQLTTEAVVSRHLYTLQPRSEAKRGKVKGGDGVRVYKRYPLSDDKPFDALFFPRKAELLALVDAFAAKAGRYAVAGYPHKLGLLLHGPPGTGKTSLIKALAQHTHRSIVSVSLSRVETNQELMDAVFDQRYLCKGMDGRSPAAAPLRRCSAVLGRPSSLFPPPPSPSPPRAWLGSAARSPRCRAARVQCVRARPPDAATRPPDAATRPPDAATRPPRAAPPPRSAHPAAF